MSIRARFTRPDRLALVLYIPLAVTLGFLDHRVRRFSSHVVTDFIPSVIAGTSGAPAKYRVLMPYTIDFIIRTIGADPYIVFLGVELIAIFTAVLALHVYLRSWYGPHQAIAGVFAACALLPLTFVNQYALPDTFPDLALFTLGCLFVAERRDLALAAVLLVGMFNRETTGFLVVLWALYRLRFGVSRPVVLSGLALASIAVGIYVTMRWARGFESYRLLMLPENLAVMKILPAGFDPYTRVAGYFWLVLFAPAAFFGLRAARRPGAPRFFSSALATALVIFVVAWLFAAIIELRVLVPLIPLLLPATLAYFTEPVRKDQDARASLEAGNVR